MGALSQLRDYVASIQRAMRSVFEGMAVTMSWMFRRPATVQYPFHPRAPDVKIGGPDTLPARYRGFLEVDMAICTACLLCEKACPIDCIKIDIERVTLGEGDDAKVVRAMTRFDIDMSKCMYCGLCQEPCPTECLRHTQHFEASVAHLENLVIRFVEPGHPVVPFKVKKDEEIITEERGSIAERLYVDRPWDAPSLNLQE